MKKTFQKIYSLLVLGMLLVPVKVFADGPTDSPVKLELPNSGLEPVKTNALSVFANIFQFAFGIAIALATLSLVTNGIRYMAAFGDEKQIDKAKNGLLYSVIGLALLILAFTIAATINTIFIEQP